MENIKMAPIKEKFMNNSRSFWKDPRKWIKYSVLFICSLVVMYQLYECYSKLREPPITTHSHFDLNESVSYPAITFCRDPPYKYDVLEKYNLSYHPKFQNFWFDFPFDTVDLDDLFNQSTYGENEYFMLKALNKLPGNVAVLSNLHLNLGQCQTVIPLTTTEKSLKPQGYSLLLHHTMKTMSDTLSDIPPGWHVYLHEPHEKFSEVNMENTGRVEYFYVTAGEELEIKLTAQHFNKLPNLERFCSFDRHYSEIECMKECQSAILSKTTDCTAPFLENYQQMPKCKNYSSISRLIKEYQKLYDSDTSKCNCLDPCNSVIYSSFIISRGDNPYNPYYTQIYMYYTSKVITVYQEHFGYGLPQFIADMGGSLGFLLGLSVLGFIGILQKIVLLCCGHLIDDEHSSKKKPFLKGSTDNSFDEPCSSTPTIPSQTILSKQKY